MIWARLELTYLDATLLTVVLVGLMIGSRRELRAAFSDVPRHAWTALGAGVALWLGVVAHVVPHSVWSTHTHDFGRVADIREGITGITGAALHGPGTTTVIANPVWATGGRLTLFQAAEGASALTLCALFLLGWRLYRSTSGAFGAAVFMGTAPAWLRLTATPSQLIPAGLYLALSLLLTELFAATGSARLAAACATALSLLMQTRAEMIPLGPLSVGLLLLWRRPQILTELRRRDLWAVLVGFVLSLVPWLVALATFDDDRTHGEARILSLPTFTIWFVGVAIIRLLAAPPERLRAVRIPAPVAAAATLTWLAQVPRLVPPTVLPSLHPLWEPDYTGPVHPALFLLGAATLLVRRPVALAWLTCGWFASVHLVVPAVDSPSTYIRASAPSWIYLALTAAAVAHEAETTLARWLPRARVLVPMLWFTALAIDGRARLDWLTRLYPPNHELALIEALRERLGPDDLVVTLAPHDLPDGIADEPRYKASIYDRNGPAWVIGGTPIDLPPDAPLPARSSDTHHRVGIRTWLEDRPVTSGTTWYLRTASCSRALFDVSQNLFTSGETTWRRADVHSGWKRTELRPSHVRAFTEHPYEDPWCASMEASAHLEPVLLIPLEPGNQGSLMEELFGPEPTLGLYRVLPEPIRVPEGWSPPTPGATGEEEQRSPEGAGSQESP